MQCNKFDYKTSDKDYDENKTRCTDCLKVKWNDELYGDLNKINDYGDKWMNDLFTCDDFLCDPCLENRFKKIKEL